MILNESSNVGAMWIRADVGSDYYAKHGEYHVSS
jgi:hypothetical protein